MKIWHPNTDNLAGGPKTFMKYFDKYFANELVSSVEDTDVIFGLNNWVPIDILKTKKVPYVHRCNGVYRPGLLNFPNWEERNAQLKPHYELADQVIFQSEFSKNSYFEFIGETLDYKIIYNGVDTNKFPLLENSRERIYMIGQVVNQQQKEREMMLSGIPLVYRPPRYNTYEEFVSIFSKCDLALDTCDTSSCPNLNLELMSSGIPVLSWEGSGGAELTIDNLIVNNFNVEEKILQSRITPKKIRNYVQEHFNIMDKLKQYKRVMEYEIKKSN